MNEMDELKRAFYEVMYKYKKCFSEQGVMANLNAWAKNKASLLALLRRHPNWNETEKAIVFDFAEERCIDREIVDEVAYTMLCLAQEQIEEERIVPFQLAFRAAINEYRSTLTEDALNVIRRHGQIKCVTGQKTSRIIGRLCQAFQLDKHARYNAVFAQLADALNPLQIQKTAILSLHPCDFLEMSNKDNTWTSCHNLKSGSYQAGALSYMTDGVSMIFFTVDKDVKNNFYRAPRRSRQMFFYRDNMLFQSRLYPSDQDELMEQYRGLVQKAIALCLDKPNLWLLKADHEELLKYLETVKGSRQYPDYNYQGNLSVLKGTQPEGVFHIGHPALCVCCGKPFKSGYLKCDCDNYVVCKDCGMTVSESSANYIDNAWYCKACLHSCVSCGRQVTGTMYPAYNQCGNLVSVCHDCYQAAVLPCADCGVRSVCQIIGRALCRRTAVPIEGSAAA